MSIDITHKVGGLISHSPATGNPLDIVAEVVNAQRSRDINGVISTYKANDTPARGLQRVDDPEVV